MTGTGEMLRALALLVQSRSPGGVPARGGALSAGRGPSGEGRSEDEKLLVSAARTCQALHWLMPVVCIHAGAPETPRLWLSRKSSPVGKGVHISRVSPREQ